MNDYITKYLNKFSTEQLTLILEHCESDPDYNYMVPFITYVLDTKKEPRK